jgi:hypothetical protein
MWVNSWEIVILNKFEAFKELTIPQDTAKCTPFNFKLHNISRLINTTFGKVNQNINKIIKEQERQIYSHRQDNYTG